MPTKACRSINLQKARQRNILLMTFGSIIVLGILLTLFLIYKHRKNRIIADQKIQQLEEEKKHMAARFLVDERDIVGIGVDTGSVDPGNAADFSVHGIVNGSGLYHLENLADLSGLPEAGAYLIVAPIKIEGGSGGQVRVFGVIL